MGFAPKMKADMASGTAPARISETRLARGAQRLEPGAETRVSNMLGESPEGPQAERGGNPRRQRRSSHSDDALRHAVPTAAWVDNEGAPRGGEEGLHIPLHVGKGSSPLSPNVRNGGGNSLATGECAFQAQGLG